MAWYKAGQVNVTKGNTAVSGVGTRWASNARVGDAFRGPDGDWYEIVNIASETTMGILPAYQGATVSGSSTYVIAPIQGYNKESADRLRKITDGIQDISDNVENAASSASAAKTSETNAASSASKAATSATNAKTSETNAATSATNSANSATAAKTSETNAATSATNAKTSETNANNSKTAAASSASAASTSANAASSSQTAAKSSETAAANSASASAASATDSASSASAANSSKNAAASSQTAANTSASNAKTSETNAKTSETNANTSKNAAATSATNASASEAKAKAWATNPENSAVESGQYSALHWAAKAKASADAAEGVTGARLTSIAKAVMAVNDMLIADTTTTMKSISTGATGRALLAASDQAAGRSALGLPGTTGSAYGDAIPGYGGNLMRVGAFGLGSTDLIDVATGTDLNTLNATGFYQTNGGANTNSPFNLSGQMIVMTNAGNHITQILSPQDKTGRLFTRSSIKTSNTDAAPDFGAWSQVVMVGDFGVGSSGYLTYMSGSVDDYTRANGLYSVNAANEGTKPSGQNYGILEVLGRNNIAGSGSRVVQIWHATDGSALSQMWVRHVSTSTPFTWTDWREMAGIDSIKTELANVGLGLNAAANAIPASVDLNDYVTSGLYGQSQNAQASNGSNYPVPKAGTLLVQNGGSVITTQQYAEYDTGTVWTRSRYNSSWSSWKMQWDTGNLFKTSNALDTTAGSIMRVGDFGLGVVGIPPTITNIDSFSNPTGFYRTASGTGTWPPGTTTYGILLIESYSTDYTKQSYVGNIDGGGGGKLWTRVCNNKSGGGGWTAWQQTMQRNDLTGWGLNSNIGTAGATLYPNAFATNIDDFDLGNGIYAVENTSTGTKPSGQSWGMLTVMGRNFSAGRVVQIWNETETGSGGYSRSWRRLNYGRAWSAWVQDLSMNDLNSPTSFNAEVSITAANQVRLRNGASDAPGVIHRVDSSNYYILLTDPGNSTGGFNTLRPFRIGLTTGLVDFANGVTGASPSSGDRSNRLATTTWVGSELNSYAPKANPTFTGSVDVPTQPASDNSTKAASTAHVTAVAATKENTIATGSTNQFWRGDKTWQDFGTMTRGQSLANVNVSLSGTIQANDNILTGFGKTQAQLNAIVGDNQNITTIRATKYIDKIFVSNASGSPYNCNLNNQTNFELTLTGNTTLAFTGIPTLNTNELLTVVVTIKQGSTARTLTLPSNTTIIAPGGVIATPAANKQQDYIFTTKNGTAWEVRAGAST